MLVPATRVPEVVVHAKKWSWMIGSRITVEINELVQISIRVRIRANCGSVPHFSNPHIHFGVAVDYCYEISVLPAEKLIVFRDSKRRCPPVSIFF